MDKVTMPSDSMAFAVIASSRGTIRGYSEPQPIRTVIISAPTSPPATTQVLKLEIDETKLPVLR